LGKIIDVKQKMIIPQRELEAMVLEIQRRKDQEEKDMKEQLTRIRTREAQRDHLVQG
jgi:hypothetical protein